MKLYIYLLPLHPFMVSTGTPLLLKGKGHPITGHQKPRGGSRGIALLILDLGSRRGWVVSTTPRPLYPRERRGTHCTGGWVGPRAGLDVCEKSRPHRDSIPGPSSQSLYQLSSPAHTPLFLPIESNKWTRFMPPSAVVNNPSVCFHA
jgi:hypothetical protein